MREIKRMREIKIRREREREVMKQLDIYEKNIMRIRPGIKAVGILLSIVYIVRN